MNISFHWPFRWPIRIDRSSVGKIVYGLPDPAKFTKAFNAQKAFLPNAKGMPPVDWTKWKDVIDEYESRVLVWYIHPVDEQINNKHGSVNPAYPLMFTLCALIDLLAQYAYDLDWHSPKHYQRFVRDKLPEFNATLTSPIEYTREDRNGGWQQSKLKTRAQVFYAGFRCSLLHHGDLASFCGMTALQPDAAGTPTLLKVIPNAGTSLDGKHSYDLHVVDPTTLKNRVIGIFRQYCNELRANPNSALAKSYRRKFEQDYGVKI